MTLKENKYVEKEYADDEDFVIGLIVFHDGKMLHAKLADEYISSLEDIVKIEEFLKIVKRELE